MADSWPCRARSNRRKQRCAIRSIFGEGRGNGLRRDGKHTLRVTMSGDHIECYYDGQKYLDARDSTLSGPGKIGLWTKADARSQFDNLTLIAN